MGHSGSHVQIAPLRIVRICFTLATYQIWVVQIVGDKFGMGIDDTHMKLRGAPVLDEPALSAHQKMIADKLTVSELMTVAMIALPPVAKVRQPAAKVPLDA